MTKEQAMAMLKAKRECIELDTNGNAELCDRNCGECKLNYEQGNMGEQKIALEMAIKALEQSSDVENLIKEVSEQEMWLNSAGYNAYNVDIAFKSIIRAIQALPPVTPKISTSDDCVSRQAVLDEIKSMSNTNPSYWATCDVIDREDLIDSIKDLPSVTPTHGTCKDCENWNESEVVKND